MSKRGPGEKRDDRTDEEADDSAGYILIEGAPDDPAVQATIRDLAERLVRGPMGRLGIRIGTPRVIQIPEYNPLTESLGPVTKSPDGKTVTAETNLCFSEWSARSRILHGPDTMLPLALLLKELLAKNEEVAAIDSLRWNGVMKKQLCMTASLKKSKKADGTQASRPQMEGRFTTTAGRKVYLRALASNTSISPFPMGINPYAEALILPGIRQRQYGPLSGSHFFPTSSLNPPSVEAHRTAHQGLLMSTYLDAICTIADASFGDGVIETHGCRLFAGVENLRLPTQDELLCNAGGGLKIKFRMEGAKPTKSGLLIVPVEVSLVDARGSVKSGGTCFMAIAPSYQASLSFMRTCVL